MIIIVVGSSPLAYEISDILGCTSIRFAPGVSFERVLAWARSAKHVVVRGHPLDACVNSHVAPWQVHMVDRCLLAAGATIVGVDGRDGFSVSEDSFLPMIRATTEADAAEVARLISQMNSFLRPSFSALELWESVGNLGQLGRPLMLVGDRYPGGRTVGDGRRGRAFSLPRNGSVFLHRALDLLPRGVASRVYLTNLNKTGVETSDECVFRAELAALQPERVVALGKKVAAGLTAMGVEHGEAPHPQHAARFFYRTIGRYAEELAHALGEEAL